MEYIDIVNQIKQKYGDTIREDVFKSYIDLYREVYQQHNPHNQSPKSGFTDVVGWGTERLSELKILLKQNGIEIIKPPYTEEINPNGLSETGLKRLSELENKIR